MVRFSPFQRLAIGTTAITYFLILVGGLVRASGAGLGCPDWPKCFGSWIPPASAAELPAQFDPSQFNQMLMWTEYLNRLLGVSVGLLILGTVVSAWRHHRNDPRILWSTIAALLLTGFQGWLGGRVVAHELAAWIVTAHLVVALVIVSLLLYATVTAFEDQPEGFDKTFGGGRPSGLSILATAVLILFTLIQVAIGAQVRGHVDSALDASVPRSQALGTVGFLDGLHRNTALIVLVFTVLVAWVVWNGDTDRSGPKRWAAAVVALAVAQVALGVVMAYVSLAPAAQVAHLTTASLLLGAEMVLLLLLRRQPDVLKPGNPRH